MKRERFLKALLSIAFVTLVTSVTFGQILTDYQDSTETSYVTEGTDFRLYVAPDIVYSPGWVAATNTPIGATALWTWTYTGLTGAPLSATAANQNYVEFTNATLGGPYTIDVVESNTLSVCAGATESQVVQVIAAPTAAITTADPADACGDQAAMTVNVTFTENVPVASAGYAFAIHQTIENISPTDAVLATILDADTLNYDTDGKLNTGNGLTGAASPYGYAFNTRDLDIENGLRTRYTYTLVKAGNADAAAAEGVISAISHKSDYPIVTAADINTYAFDANNSIVIVVNPVPTTGPIFHIPNNWAY